MAKLNYSQETFPRVLVIGNDTVIVLQPEQVKQINIIYEFAEMLKSENVVLQNTLEEYTLLDYKKDSIISSKIQSENELREESTIIINRLRELLDENIKLDMKLTKIKKSRKIWLISGAAAGIIGTLTLM